MTSQPETALDDVTEMDQIPVKKVEKEIDIADALHTVKRITDIIKLFQHVEIESLEKLNELYHGVKEEEYGKMLGDQLAKGQVGVIFKKNMATLDKNSPILQVLLKVCWNYSHISNNIRIDFGHAGMLQLLLADLKHNIAHQEFSSDDKSLISRLAILYNCAKSSKNKKQLKGKSTLETLLHYTNDENQTVKIVSTLTLSYVIDEEHISLMMANESVIGNIIKNLKAAMETSNHKTDGWTVAELTAGLRNLSSNRENCLVMLKYDILTILVYLLVNGNDNEQKISGETIWMLSFHDEAQELIVGDENTLQSLKNVSAKHSEIGETALGILWVLDSKARVTEKKKSTYDNKKPHIMISYQWDNQNLMARVYDELTNQGYNVWMDIHRMSGSILEAMAAAVENASIVLVCMSQKYKDSPNCRTEAEYAFNLRKTIVPIKVEQDYKAEGWLGALVGTKLYVNFSSLDSFHGETFDKKMKKLVEEIKGTKMFPTGGAHEEKIVPKSTKPLKDKAPKTSPQAPDKTSDLAAWIEKHQLKSYDVSTLNRSELRFLKTLKMKAPKVFYNFLLEGINNSKLRYMMTVSDAIDDFE